MTNRLRRGSSLPGTAALLLSLVGGCAEPPARETQEEIFRSITITAPLDGDTVEGPDVRVTLGAANLEIVPAGDTTPNSGHHHIIVNADLPAMDAAIPAVEGVYIHMGMGQTEHTLTGLDPGEYRIIALVGDHMHVPLDPVVADTVRFVVR
jgi:hypothetical protein